MVFCFSDTSAERLLIGPEMWHFIHFVLEQIRTLCHCGFASISVELLLDSRNETTTTLISRLEGEDWQDWANKLLSCHYGPTEYQQIPDNDRGDAGLEGFTRSDGHAYQAYGCEEPLATSQRYEKQRDKMTRDIGKFIENKTTIMRLLGSIRVTRWVLFVPYFDSKDIVGHATAKTNEVISAELPYVADSFQVHVVDEAHFATARDRLINATNQSLHVSVNPATPEQIADWSTLNQEPSKRLAEKLSRLPTLKTDHARWLFQNKTLDWYLQGQEILESLRQYPEVYAKVKAAKSHREGFLVKLMISGLQPQDVLLNAINELRVDLEQHVRELHKFSSESLAHEAAADWLLRCPLDFPEAIDA